MKKLFIMLLFLTTASGATTNKSQPQKILLEFYDHPINSKLDSINVKAAELNNLIRQK